MRVQAAERADWHAGEMQALVGQRAARRPKKGWKAHDALRTRASRSATLRPPFCEEFLLFFKIQISTSDRDTRAGKALFQNGPSPTELFCFSLSHFSLATRGHRALNIRSLLLTVTPTPNALGLAHTCGDNHAGQRSSCEQLNQKGARPPLERSAAASPPRCCFGVRLCARNV